MAIVTSGPYVGFRGTINGVTYFQDKKGRTISKSKNKPRSVPPSKKQVQVMNDTGIIANFMQPLKEFVSVGYSLEAARSFDNPYNVMVQEVRNNALVGSGNERMVSCPKVLMTKGRMTVTETGTAEIFETGIRYSWDPVASDSSMHWSDQSVLVAYFPVLDEIRYLGGGPERHAGKAFLQLTGTPNGYTAEVYLSFVSGGRTSISNSKYLGQLNW